MVKTANTAGTNTKNTIHVNESTYVKDKKNFSKLLPEGRQYINS